MSKRIVRKAVCGAVMVCLLWASAGAAGPADPLAETPQQRDKRMAWWREGRFGMFIHWGLYAVPAGVWDGKEVKGIGEWIMDRARIPVSDYEKLVPQFNPVKFNAAEWVALAKGAGMKYIVITSKHHDGFCLWDSKVTDYDIMTTPFKRDILKELSDECHRQGVRICWYHSIMDWHHPDQKNDFPKYHEHMKAQLRELLTSYGKIGVLWFDGEWIKQWDRQKGRDLAAFVRSLQPEIVINNRVGKRQRDDGDFGTPEQTIPARGLGYDWETCMTMNDTWGFKSSDHRWKPTGDLLHKLVDIASKGGNFLLNVGPTAEGVIPAPSVERLKEMGEWMKVNGESIYGTGPSVFRSLPWGRCTTKLGEKAEGGTGKLYLHVFAWPADGKLLLPGLATDVRKAYLLADKDRAALKTGRTEQGLVVDLPAKALDPIDTVVVLEVPATVEVAAYTIGPAKDGSYTLPAREAATHGGTARYESDKDCIGFWTNAKDWVSWDFQAPAAGKFTVEITYACEAGSGDSTYTVAIGPRQLEGKVKDTGSWTKFATEKLGPLSLEAPGKATLTLKPKTKPNLAVMNLRSIKLVPEKD